MLPRGSRDLVIGLPLPVPAHSDVSRSSLPGGCSGERGHNCPRSPEVGPCRLRRGFHPYRNSKVPTRSHRNGEMFLSAFPRIRRCIMVATVTLLRTGDEACPVYIPRLNQEAEQGLL